MAEEIRPLYKALLALIVGLGLFGFLGSIVMKTAPGASTQRTEQAIRPPTNDATEEPAIECTFVKVFSSAVSTWPQTVAYVQSDSPITQKQLIDCAVKTIKPGSKYVYFFNDLAKAQAWNPSSFSSGPQHDGCIGRAYQDKPGAPFSYTPQSEW